MLKMTIFFFAICLMPPSLSEAGWFGDTLKNIGDKVQDVGKQVTDQFVNDAGQAASDSANSAYQSTKDRAGNIGSQGDDDSSQTGVEQHKESTLSQQEEQQIEAQASTSVYGTVGKKSPGSYSHKPVRSDLQFTADTEMIDVDDPGNLMKGKMYVDGSRMRNDISSPEGQVSTIITGANPDDKIYMLMHEQKSYMASSVGDAEDDLWGALRETSPCEGYQTSKKVGGKTINGRKTVQWDCSDPEDPEDPEVTSLWIDSKLNVPIKMEGSDGSRYELKNIKEGKPSADKFKMPAGYRQMTVFGQTGHVSAGTESSSGKTTGTAQATSTPDDLKATLAKAKVPVYPGAVFCVGSTSAGLRFATKDSVDNVRNWYRSQRPTWALIDEPKYQIWVLYEGPAGIGMMEWTAYNMAQVNENKNLPEWHSLSKDMTTEIVLGVADKYK